MCRFHPMGRADVLVSPPLPLDAGQLELEFGWGMEVRSRAGFPDWKLASAVGSRSSPPPTGSQHMREGKCYDHQTAVHPPQPQPPSAICQAPLNQHSCEPTPQPALRLGLEDPSPDHTRDSACPEGNTTLWLAWRGILFCLPDTCNLGNHCNPNILF